MSRRRKPKPDPNSDLRQRILEYFEVLRIPLAADELDDTLGRAEKEGWSALEFLARLVGPHADQRRQRAIERRIRDARFHELKGLEGFDYVQHCVM